MLIFYSKYRNLLPFFLIERYRNLDEKIGFTELFEKSINSYVRYKKIKSVLIDYTEEDGESILILFTGRKISITLYALEGFFEIYEDNLKYIGVNTSKYNNYLFILGMILEKMRLKRYSKFFYRIGSRKIFNQKFQLNLTEP